MTNMNEKIENPLGTEPVGKLLRKFAVPSIISIACNVFVQYSRSDLYRTVL